MRGLTSWFRRERGPGRTLVLPASGRALVVSDLHGGWGDWQAFLAASRLQERLAAGEDLWLLLTGDVPDVARHRSVDPSVPADGDVRIMDDLLRLRASLGERAGRVVYLEGNHDFHVARIVREVAAMHGRKGDAALGAEPGAPAVTGAEYEAYCAYYREAWGAAVLENNVAPYDMVPRARAEHVCLMEGGPVLAVLGASGALVTHAGPPRATSWGARALRAAIDGACRERLRRAEPGEYYASPYHQLLNGRFRNGDYTLADLDAFLALYAGRLLVTGHTPHPYLVDFERRAPLEDCAFAHGLGVIGGRQVVLCSSFGAFHAASKRYLELDLSRPLGGVDDLLAAGGARPLYCPEDAAASPMQPLPGADIILGIEAGQPG